MKRIIDKETKLFIRDDFDYNSETEIGLDVKPAQGFYLPRWNGAEWVEGGQAPEPTPQGPTVEERLQMAEDTIMFMLMGSM